MKKQNLSDADQTEQAECKRIDDRQPIARAADLVLNEQQSPVSCLVKDISKTGLKLTYDSPHKLPKQIKVILHHPREVFQCLVVWQRENEIGLRILETD